MTEKRDWHKPEVHRHKVWKSYVDQYEDGHAFGILQENCQNSFDAYPEEVPLKDRKVLVKYNADDRVLSVRDFKTHGMFHCSECEWGELPNGEPCVAEDCAWGAFHNMGFTTKLESDSVGSRGMGKSLQLLAGDQTFVRTTLPDGQSMASEWRKDGDWVWTLAPDEAEELSNPGTEIETTGVKDVVHDVLVDPGKVVAELQRRWFRVLEEGATITFVLVNDGKKERFVVPSPTWPDLDTSLGKEKAEKTHEKIVIKYKGEKKGELQNLHLYMADEPLDKTPPLDSNEPPNGIALVKNGKQTITRFRDFRSDIPAEIRDRIYGWVEVPCTDERPFLEEAETSTHTGYKANDPVYRKVKRKLRDAVSDFAEPFVSQGGPQVTEKEAKEGDEILDVINEALQEVSGFSVFQLNDEGETKDRKQTGPRDFLYLSRLKTDSREYDRGEPALAKAIVKNPEDEEFIVRAHFTHYDPTPVEVNSEEVDIFLSPGTPENPSTEVAEWEFPIKEDLAPGIHWVHVALTDKHWEPFQDADGKDIEARYRIYVDEEKPDRSRDGGRRKTRGTGGAGFDKLQFYKKPEYADTHEAYIDVSQRTVFVNYAGRRFKHFRENAQNRRGYWPVVGEVVGEQIFDHLLKNRLQESDEWRTEDVEDIVGDLQKKRTDFVREIIRSMS